MTSFYVIFFYNDFITLLMPVRLKVKVNLSLFMP